ncbi:MAG TPA: hypothetical protein PLY93_00915 [Turneriella sp.]|nr:hypothetical protein [Turneriella sp.]
MVKLKSALVLFIALTFLLSCAFTEVAEEHSNPLDPIYDSGSFRLSLVGEDTGTSAKLSWGHIFYKDAKGSVSELTEDEIKVSGTAQVLFKNTTPSAADITTVKAAGALGGYTPVHTIPNAKESTQMVTGSYKGYYIIRFDYKYDGKTGRLYSNFVAVQ